MRKEVAVFRIREVRVPLPGLGNYPYSRWKKDFARVRVRRRVGGRSGTCMFANGHWINKVDDERGRLGLLDEAIALLRSNLAWPNVFKRPAAARLSAPDEHHDSGSEYRNRDYCSQREQ
jgi:hypothetical protein